MKGGEKVAVTVGAQVVGGAISGVGSTVVNNGIEGRETTAGDITKSVILGGLAAGVAVGASSATSTAATKVVNSLKAPV